MIPILDVATVLTSTVITVLVAGLRDDPGLADGYRYRSLSVDNSHIEMRTKRIDQIVAVGPLALGPLIQEMRRKDASLDTFARCYSACGQILRKAGLKEEVRWHGSLIQTERTSGRVVALERIDGDSSSFRQKQVEEIVSRARELGINLGR